MNNIENYVKEYRKVIENATLADIEAAALWYVDAQQVAQQVADIMGLTLEQGASIVSAFSPRERWTSNIIKALKFARGEQVQGLSNNFKMATNAKTMGFKALKGLKTNAFAKNIAGDEFAVTIDIWMIKASGLTKKSLTAKQYRELESAVIILADEHNLSPRTMQALIWICVRGGGN